MFCIGLLATLCLRVGLAQSAEFRSIGDAPAIVYDAPSAKAKKLFVASRDYPLEVIVNIEGWVKVRDAAGDLFWVEKKALSERRMLLVNVPQADVRQVADDSAPVVFRAQAGVVLEWQDQSAAPATSGAPVAPGWVRVRHRDGSQGFVRVSQVWGL
jgi:SH3-like domain-containing protein